VEEMMEKKRLVGVIVISGIHMCLGVAILLGSINTVFFSLTNKFYSNLFGAAIALFVGFAFSLAGFRLFRLCPRSRIENILVELLVILPFSLRILWIPREWFPSEKYSSQISIFCGLLSWVIFVAIYLMLPKVKEQFK